VSISFGVSPIAWINDDMPELGGDTPVETVLGDARDIGFAGVELGGKFPRDPVTLNKLLKSFDLQLIGGWYSSNLLIRSADEEIRAMQEHLSLLKALGSPVFVIAETSNAIHGNRGVPLAQSPVLAADEWEGFGERMTAIGDHVAAQGLRLAYHHHLGTVVEDAAEIDRFLEHTGPNVGLTLDTGHAALGGIDPVQVIGAHPGRVVHVHCKDVRRSVFDRLLARDGSFLDGVLDGMFTAPGDGDLDFARLIGALSAIGYSGWVVIEAEQDPEEADPRDYSRLGLDTLRREARAAGLKEAA
jgi:inosose dehydratase